MKLSYTINLKSASFALLGILVLLFFTGCVRAPIMKLGPTSAMISPLATNITSPNTIEFKRIKVIPYDSSEIEILGWYEKGISSSGLNGRLPFAGSSDLMAVKDSDFESTYTEIIEQNNLDGLMNLTVDTKRFVINLIFVRFSNWQTSVGGIGYRMRNKEALLGLADETSN